MGVMISGSKEEGITRAVATKVVSYPCQSVSRMNKPGMAKRQF
jgi:hypothetical protein